jgi:N-acetylmuramic acid 6-phosphate etherase
VNDNSRRRSDEFLKISGQFKLGALVTESSHPVTANLSEVAKTDIAAALKLLFDVDDDVVRKFREFVESGRAGEIKEAILHSLKSGGRIFFTGCGSTGRLSILLDSIWRDFWRQKSSSRGNEAHSKKKLEPPYVGCYEENLENRAISVMAGGDYALIKSVEGFEDFTAFGRKQINDLGVSSRDIVFAITEGGETSFVIGTAWAGVEAGAKVYFVYNNPDDVLCRHVERSREIIEDPRIEKINLTTGPMAIAGSTRMQATSIQLCVLLTVLEMVVRDLLNGRDALPRVPADQQVSPARSVPTQFLAQLEEIHNTLKSPEVLTQLAKLVELEETVYRAGHKINYFANRFGIDVLTDTTERSPTYCTPPFRKFDDKTAAESWAFLFLPDEETPKAWERILKRNPRCIEWTDDEVRELVDGGKFLRTCETVRKISRAELMRFKIGLDGLPQRVLKPGDCAIGILSETEEESLLSPDGFHRVQQEAARKSGAKAGLICFRSRRREEAQTENPEIDQSLVTSAATIILPETDLLLDGVTRMAVKLVLNALSTCTMVRLGRVMGNCMIYVVPSNLKLIDRATRHIARLTGLNYEAANRLLFEVMEFVEPRMKSDRAYPPVVGMAVLRARENLTNEQAEKHLPAR